MPTFRENLKADLDEYKCELILNAIHVNVTLESIEVFDTIQH